MTKLSVTEQKCVDDTLEHLRKAMVSVISAMHTLDHTTPMWSILQHTAHNVAKASLHLEDDVKGYECECKAHKGMDRDAALVSAEQHKTKSKSKRYRHSAEN